MERKKFPVNIDKKQIFANQEKALSFICEKRSSFIEYYEGEDEGGRYVLPLIKYNIFSGYNEIFHGFSTRYGGVSEGHLSSLNLSFSRGDERERVLINHKRLGRAIGYDETSLVFSDQIHESKIHIVSGLDKGKGITRESDIVGIDGLLTDVSGVPLITFYADCVPNFFFDPVKRVVGLAHSGWRGTARRIGRNMIETMAATYGSKPEDILCAIGPSICKSCYEVSKDVADEFERVFKADEYSRLITERGNDKYLLDLQLACKYNLLNAGVLEEHVAMPDLCTCCNPDFLFSHRASEGMRGNLAAVIGLKN